MTNESFSSSRDRSSPSRFQLAARWFGAVVVLLALILVPFFLLEDSANAATEWLIARERPPAAVAGAVVFLLAADVVLPIPSSLVSTASGGLFGWRLGACVSWVGMTVGCLLAWLLARQAGRAGLLRLVGDAELVRAGRLVARYGAAALVLSRPIPVLAEASVLLAAACGLPFSRFITYCALANAGISLAYAAVGAFAANVSSFLIAFLGAVALPGVSMLLIEGRRGFRSQEEKPNNDS